MQRQLLIVQTLGAAVIGLLICIGTVGAQSVPRLKPLPPKKARPAVTAQAHSLTAPLAALAGTWQMLPNQPPVLDIVDCGPGSPLLLTDGTVLVADNGCLDWWKLTPDEFGSYVNGTWTQIASTPADYSPLYHASAVLPDGRVIIEGGEYNHLQAVWTNQGAIYDPLTDTWTEVSPPAGWTTVGDAVGVVLFDGTFMLGNCCTVPAALLGPTIRWCGSPTTPPATSFTAGHMITAAWPSDSTAACRPTSTFRPRRSLARASWWSLPTASPPPRLRSG